MNRMRKGKHGQAMTEYIIIVAIIALAALAIFGLFGDRLRAMIGGAVTDLGGNQGDVDTATQTKSADYLKTLGTTGTTP
jgi:Flp pilus assembly pilin Flp